LRRNISKPAPKKRLQCEEGPIARKQFERAMKALFQVPKTHVQRKIRQGHEKGKS